MVSQFVSKMMIMRKIKRHERERREKQIEEVLVMRILVANGASKTVYKASKQNKAN